MRDFCGNLVYITVNNIPKTKKIYSTCLIFFLIPVILGVALVVSLVYFPQIYFPQIGKHALIEIERTRYGKSIERFSEILGNQPIIKQFIKSRSYIVPPSPSFSPEGNKLILIIKGEKEDEIQLWDLTSRKIIHKCKISRGLDYKDIYWGKSRILLEECNKWEYDDTDSHQCVASTVKLVSFSTCQTEEIVNPNNKVDLNDNTLFSKDLRYLAKWNCGSSNKNEKCSYDIIDRTDNAKIIWSFKDIPEILNASFSKNNRYLALLTRKKIVLIDLQLLKINSVETEIFTYGEMEISFSPDSSLLAVFSRGVFSAPGLVKISSLPEKLRDGATARFLSARFTSDSSQIIVSRCSELYRCSVFYIDAKTGKQLKEIMMPDVKTPDAQTLKSPNEWETCDYSDVSNDGRYMFKQTCHAAGDEDSDCMMKSLHLWEIEGNAPPGSAWEIDPGNVVFSPDSRFIAIPFGNGIGIWKLRMRGKINRKTRSNRDAGAVEKVPFIDK